MESSFRGLGTETRIMGVGVRIMGVGPGLERETGGRNLEKREKGLPKPFSI